MKTVQILVLTFGFTFFNTNLNAQTNEELVQATITLANGTVQNGLAKENLAKKGSIIFTENNTTKKQVYNGINLQKLTINGSEYISIKGDFFKIICSGKISFLQKASKTSSEILYNGSDPIGIAGTDGKLGDYYFYKSNTLTLLTKKNIATELANNTNDCTTPVTNIDKENFASLATVINNYNNCK